MTMVWGPTAQIRFPRIGYTSTAKVLSTPLARARGLMFKRRVAEPLLFVFPTTSRHANSIHSFFCPPFDAAFVSTEMKVVDYMRNVPANKPLLVPRGDCGYLVEALPESLAGLRPGDKFAVSKHRTPRGR